MKNEQQDTFESTFLADIPEGVQVPIAAQRKASARLLWIVNEAYPRQSRVSRSLMSMGCLLKSHFGQIVLTRDGLPNRVADGVPLLRVDSHCSKFLESVFSWFQPTFVATTGSGINIAAQFLEQQMCPCRVFVYGHKSIDFLYNIPSCDCQIIVESDEMRERIRQVCTHDATILPPPIIPWISITAERAVNPSINCVGLFSGPDIAYLKEAATAFPRELFRVLKPAYGLFPQMASSLAYSLAECHNDVYNLSSWPFNMHLEAPFFDIKALYASTKVLILSGREDGISERLLVESFQNHIPVVVCDPSGDTPARSNVFPIQDLSDRAVWLDCIRMALESSEHKQIKKTTQSLSEFPRLEVIKRKMLNDVFAIQSHK